ncbi:MAG: dihydroorotate dehydrogenase-like protein [Alistipes sp.]|nr:dihydroorotate dehydrogenase-like protein [Alistipes senegalensis]MCM1249778.1 dihydroorotate dehydrogenase-like protein [Alistipes sp.]
MKTNYLGLELSSPVVVASSPYTATRAGIEKCAACGAGAVVLKSIFEEQVLRRSAAYDFRPQGMGDSGEYLESYLGDAYKLEFLQLIRDARKTGLPVIASINCVSAGEGWIDYAAAMADAGAAALELNIFVQPADPTQPAQQIESAYAEIVRRVVGAVEIPVSVKLPMRLTNVLALADTLRRCGARGVVLFNRFFEPDIDIEKLEFVAGDPFSAPSELRNVLRSAALCTSAVPELDLAVSTGVHDGEAAVKALLCGARAVQVCTAIRRSGYQAIGRIGAFVDEWATRHGFADLEACYGKLNYGEIGNAIFQRVQYMKYFPSGAE